MTIHQHNAGPTPLLDTPAASRFLRVSKSFLDKSRVKGDGPPFTKVGRNVRYRLTDIQKWLDGQQHSSTSSVGVH